ncbi:MAG: class I adenylate-forming enzyme family protein [Hyphomicrobiales bacterium]
MSQTGSLETLRGLLEEQARRIPRSTACRFEDVEIDYAGFNAAVDRVGAALHGLGVSKGDRVVIGMPNHLDMLVLFFAVAKLGAINVFLNPAYHAELLRRLVSTISPKAMVLDEATLDKLDERSPGSPIRIVWPEKRSEAADMGYRDLAAADAGRLPQVDISPGDPVQFIFTSGTTGLPKACILSHRARLALCKHINRCFDATDEDCYLGCLPNYHGNVFLGLISSMLVGGCFALLPKFSASRYWDEVRRHNASILVLHLVPANILLNSPPDRRDRGHRVRGLFTVGGRIAEFLERFGVRTGLASYGSTEAGGLVSLAPVTHEEAAAKPSSYGGKVRDDMEVCIVDEHDQPLPYGETGEIIVRPRVPHVLFSGYSGQPEQTMQVCRNFWFHTGDLGVLSENGDLVFMGRARESIRVKGAFVPVEYIESLIRQHDSVTECALVGVPSKLGEQEIKAFIQPRSGFTLRESDIIEYLRERIPKSMLPASVEFVTDFPRAAATLKIQKNRLVAPQEVSSAG